MKRNIGSKWQIKLEKRSEWEDIDEIKPKLHSIMDKSPFISNLRGVCVRISPWMVVIFYC